MPCAYDYTLNYVNIEELTALDTGSVPNFIAISSDFLIIASNDSSLLNDSKKICVVSTNFIIIEISEE